MVTNTKDIEKVSRAVKLVEEKVYQLAVKRRDNNLMQIANELVDVANRVDARVPGRGVRGYYGVFL